MKIVLFCWKCHRLLVFFFCFFFFFFWAGFVWPLGPAAAGSPSLNQRESVLFSTFPPSFMALDGAASLHLG